MTGELVLIVEDNEVNLRLLRDLLQAHGFRTLEAMTAGEGIALATEHRPDLVLMDIQLPDLDGVAALQRLRAEPQTTSIPVVAVTAFALTADRERISAAGFDGYVTKPIETRKLPEQIRQYCGDGR